MIEARLIAAGYVRDAATGVWCRPDSEVFGYSDGDVEEDSLLAALRSMRDVSLASAELNAHAQGWAALYHLTPVRSHILRPIEASLGDKVLELGAGCGAITRWLGETGRAIVAVEGSHRRATICRERCRDLPNVTVVCERIERFPLDLQFDSVTLIGVLEYAAQFGLDLAAPDKALLERARQWCRPDGVLAVAIENRLGLKYWAGAPEDHLGLPLVGVHAAYRAGEPRTYSRGELIALLESAGFSAQSFLLPFPDYKVPSTVLFPRSGAPEHRELVANLVRFSNSNDPQKFESRISTEAVWPTLAREGSLSAMANSFLVVSGGIDNAKVAELESSEIVAVHFGGRRAPAFRKQTVFVEENGKIVVQRNRLAKGRAAGAKSMFPAREELVLGKPWVAQLQAIVRRDDWRFEHVVGWAGFWLQSLFNELKAQGIERPNARTVIPPALLDAGPQNLLVDPEGHTHFVDLEWTIQRPITVGFVAFRALLWSLLLITWSAPTARNPHLTIGSALPALFEGIGLDLSESSLEDYLAQEEAFQTLVSGAQVRLNREFLRQRWGSRGRRRRGAGFDSLGIDVLDVRVYAGDGVREFTEEASFGARVELEDGFVQVHIDVEAPGLRTLRIDPTSQLGFFKLHGIRVGTLSDVSQMEPAELTTVRLQNGDFMVASAGTDPSWTVTLDAAVDTPIRVTLAVARATDDDIREASRALYAARLASAHALDAEQRQSQLLTERATTLEANLNAAQRRLAEIESHPIMRLARRAQKLARTVTRRVRRRRSTG